MKTPLAKDPDDEGNMQLALSEATAFRRGAARLNYMAQDRIDLGGSSKGAFKGHGMSNEK